MTGGGAATPKGFWQQLPDALLLWPNRITLLRILCVPLLFWLALEEYRIPFALFCGFLWLTDCVDGIIARWLKQESTFGARFDSLADNIVYGSMVVWVYLFEPMLFREYRILIAIVGIAILASQIFAYVRYGHAIDFHTYLSKAAMFCTYLFVIVLVMRGFNPLLFTIFIASICLATLENILMTALFRDAQQNVPSIFLRWFKRDRQ